MVQLEIVTTIQDTGDVIKTIVTTIQDTRECDYHSCLTWPQFNPNDGLTKLLGSSLLSEIDWSTSIDIFSSESILIVDTIRCAKLSKLLIDIL